MFSVSSLFRLLLFLDDVHHERTTKEDSGLVDGVMFVTAIP